MALKDEAKAMFETLFGPDIAKQLDSFDDPVRYPKDFIDECLFFMEKFIGEAAAKKKFEPLYMKYCVQG